jgi:hypothetical protein
VGQSMLRTRRYCGLNWQLFNFFGVVEMNKFEALKQFQAWPPEWQRLCAECWIETGEDRPAVALPVPGELFPYGQPVSRQVIQCNADAIPFDQPKAAAKVAAVSNQRRTRGRSVSLAWSVPESEYLLKLVSEQWEQCHVVRMFLEEYPGRSPDAVRRRVWGVRSGKESGEVKY